MGYRISWSSQAKSEAKAIFKYLKIHWSHRSAKRFRSTLAQLTNSLSNHPHRGRPSELGSSIRLLKIDHHNFLVYELRETENEIMILNVLPYRMDHSVDQRF